MRLSKSLALCALFPFTFDVFAQKDGKPNIIFFLMDDMGYGDLGINGQTKIETPNIDALAIDGKRFTQHYSGAPVSAPSRCTLLTGLHSGHSAIRGNDEAAERGDIWSFQSMFENPSLEGQKEMPSQTRTIAHQLQDAGYTTACIGKWGLGAPNSQSTPNKMGFDYFYGYNCQRVSHSYYPTHLYKNDDRILLNNSVIEQNTLIDKDADPLSPSSYDKFIQNDYAPALMFAETINFIDHNKTNPFFIWWTTPMPHAPMSAPQELIDKYIKKFGDEKPSLQNGYYPVRYPHATYAAMVEYLDQQIGKIVEKLKKENIYDNTIIIFTSDNGPSSEGGGDSPYFNSAAPYSNAFGMTKGSLNEGGIRVPLIVKWSGVIEPNSVSHHLSYFPDWMPTICQIAHAKVPKHNGISMVNEFRGDPQKKHTSLYWEFPQIDGQIAVRQGAWKLIIKDIKNTPIYFLFNVVQDPQESTNLYLENPSIAKRLFRIAQNEHTEPINPSFKMPFPR